MRWTFDPIERLEALIKRQAATLDYLRQVRFNTPRERRIPVEWRILHTADRLDRMRLIARAQRHNRRWDLKKAEAAETTIN